MANFSNLSDDEQSFLIEALRAKTVGYAEFAWEEAKRPEFDGDILQDTELCAQNLRLLGKIDPVTAAYAIKQVFENANHTHTVPSLLQEVAAIALEWQSDSAFQPKITKDQFKEYVAIVSTDPVTPEIGQDVKKAPVTLPVLPEEIRPGGVNAPLNHEWH